ncbi:hypothetical protein BJV82DRAFT_714027 [Fennellomyces sp. T-0311]|nr:hypothetical protein BJV82DRAFT_714027 [Fennellomyces sp. T-0311]
MLTNLTFSRLSTSMEYLLIRKQFGLMRMMKKTELERSMNEKSCHLSQFLISISIYKSEGILWLTHHL